jgi:hypothetical protein
MVKRILRKHVHVVLNLEWKTELPGSEQLPGKHIQVSIPTGPLCMRALWAFNPVEGWKRKQKPSTISS